MTTIHDLRTPALIVDTAVLDANLAAMAAARPGLALRPHVKAFKTTKLASLMATRHGHTAFCCATLREMEGMAAAGLGDDLLLANETLDIERLTELTVGTDARITVAVDSMWTIEAAAKAGVREVLIDVDVGLPRCGCLPSDAGRLASEAKQRGLEVRGVMGYEGHCQDWEDAAKRRAEVEKSMDLLRRAHDDVGGDMISAGGTGTHAMNDTATEIQAGSYALMDTHYQRLSDLPFQPAIRVLATVISTRPGPGGWYVADAGLKAFGMDHGNPTADLGQILFCSDEHTTVLAEPELAEPELAEPELAEPELAEPELNVEVGQRVTFVPAHIDPTVAKHPMMHLVDGDNVIDSWPIDLRDW